MTNIELLLILVIMGLTTELTGSQLQPHGQGNSENSINQVLLIGMQHPKRNKEDPILSRQFQTRLRQCLIRTCNQRITGRNLSYRRALQIVQNEEYLSAADLDVIRKGYNVNLRKKRQVEVIYGGQAQQQPQLQAAGINLFQQNTNSASNNRNITADYSAKPYLAGALIFGAVILFVQPNVQPVFQGQAFPDQPQPGTPGGGGLPIRVSPEAEQALDLVPDGLFPVAVFPPYATPRTFPAVSVIFSESTGTNLNGRRRKRGLALQRNFLRDIQAIKRKAQAYSQSNHLLHIDNWLRSKIQTLRRNLKCLNVRLARNLGLILKDYRPQLNQSYPGMQDYGDHDEDVDNQLPTWDHCFEDIPRPLFGFRTEVTLVNNQTCILDETCDINGNKLGSDLFTDNEYQSFHEAGEEFERQTSEDFFSEAPPDCRAVLAPRNAC